MKKIQENLHLINENHLYPFFWQNGDSDEVIIDYINQIEAGGIKNLCIESRVHPEFLEQGWWDDLDLIIKVAKEKKMKIWILDDARFPTGLANGKVPFELQKKYLHRRRLDFVGPMKDGEINLNPVVDFRVLMTNKEHLQDKIYKVLLVKNDTQSFDAFDESSIVDLTHLIEDQRIRISLEAGNYSVFIIYYTSVGFEDSTKNYLDPTRKEATQILLNEVYEKHYQRYPKEFGTTIVGFFSDEPRFGNIKGVDATIGVTDMPLPWNKEIEEQLALQPEDTIFLFQGESIHAKEVRFKYMNLITRLYSENFSQYIGEWCKNHQVDYVGHTIEDNNVHTKLGYGTGHYFRGIAGQSIAGIDVIGGQLVPGMDYYHESFSTGGSDGEFYHYALCKLGASAAKLDPTKRGLLMCEAFGAYGWIEGLKMMKWITNHLLSHGVNMIVPHAFNPKEFPDWDCPPHFYAHGNNPQYPYFTLWSNYTNRLCHLLQDGFQSCEVAVLYNAFVDWSGKNMPVQKVVKELLQNQVDCSILSEDYLLGANLEEDCFIINHHTYKMLLVPTCEYVPELLKTRLEELSKKVPVYFIDEYPSNCRIGNVVPLQVIKDKIAMYKEISLSTLETDLIYYHYVQEDGDVFLFNNESIHHTITTEVTLVSKEEVFIYDSYRNECIELKYERSEDSITFRLELEPYQLLVLVHKKDYDCRIVKEKKKKEVAKVSNIEVGMKAYNEKEYSNYVCMDSFTNVGIAHPTFTGTLSYKFNLHLDEQDCLLGFEHVGELVEVRVNGIECGSLIAPPYSFDISNGAVQGENLIEVLTTNNLSRALRDPLSQFMMLEHLGIIGELYLYK